MKASGKGFTCHCYREVNARDKIGLYTETVTVDDVSKAPDLFSMHRPPDVAPGARIGIYHYKGGWTAGPHIDDITDDMVLDAVKRQNRHDFMYAKADLEARFDMIDLETLDLQKRAADDYLSTGTSPFLKAIVDTESPDLDEAVFARRMGALANTILQQYNAYQTEMGKLVAQYRLKNESIDVTREPRVQRAMLNSF